MQARQRQSVIEKIYLGAKLQIVVLLGADIAGGSGEVEGLGGRVEGFSVAEMVGLPSGRLPYKASPGTNCFTELVRSSPPTMSFCLASKRHIAFHPGPSTGA